MGLKQVGFIDWFQFKFPEAVRNVPRREQARFDSVFVDVNCILHPAVLGAKNEATFIKNLFLILDKLLSQFIPTRICYFSVDGPAPAAKIVTQKSRRATKGGSKASSGMSKLQITPGCPFMTRLERYLSYYAVRYLQQRDKRDVPPTLKFVVDHSNNPGEGESKIIENIVQQANNIRGRPCAIISVDSDAVLQAIAIGVPNVYAVRKGNPSKPVLVISIDRFMRTIEELFPGESDRVRLDFCALCLFRGNDYLRGLTVGLDTLWKAYLYTKLVDPVIQQRGALRHLIDAEFKTFDLVFLKQLLFNSYKNSRNLELPRNLQPRSQLQPQQHPSKSPKPPQSQPTPLQPQPTPLQPQPTPLQPQEQYQAGEGVYELASDMESADEDIDSETDDDEDEDKNKNENNDAEDPITGQDSEDETATKKFSINKFLTGVLWNLEMYCSGKCPDVSFCYNYPSSPPRRALISFVNSTAQMKRYRTLQPSATTKLISVERSDKKYLHPLVCALILLPQEKGAMYLPQSIAPLHTQLVPSESRYLSFDEMEAVDVKVRKLIDILKSSEKPNDQVIARELSELYDTRLPYIWARHSYFYPGSRPTVLPLNPGAILDELDINTASSEVVTAALTTPKSRPQFPDLLPESDIRCNLVKTPLQQQDLQVDGGSGHDAATDDVHWAQAVRQEALTEFARRFPPRWPFIYVRAKAQAPQTNQVRQPSPQLSRQHQPQQQQPQQQKPQQEQSQQSPRKQQQHPTQQQPQKKNQPQKQQPTQGQSHRKEKQPQQPSQQPQTGQQSRPQEAASTSSQ